MDMNLIVHPDDIPQKSVRHFPHKNHKASYKDEMQDSRCKKKKKKSKNKKWNAEKKGKEGLRLEAFSLTQVPCTHPYANTWTV